MRSVRAGWHAGGVLKRIVINAVAVAIATWLIPGITLVASDTVNIIITLLVAGVILGLLNAIVKPILHFISFPLIVITLGLFLWVVNAGVLLLASSAAGALGIGWQVAGWGSALAGALVISLVNLLLDRAEQPRL